MSGIYSCITAVNYFEDYGLGNKTMKDLVENILTKATSEACESAIGRCFEEIKTTEETKPGIIASSR